MTFVSLNSANLPLLSETMQTPDANVPQILDIMPATKGGKVGTLGGLLFWSPAHTLNVPESSFNTI